MYVQSRIMDSVRAYVGVEGLYSKAQKDAIIHLHAYARTRDIAEYNGFIEFLELNRAAQLAREGMQSAAPDLDAIKSWLMRFDIAPEDAEGMIWLFINFKNMPYMSESVQIWEDGDALVSEIRRVGQDIAELIGSNALVDVSPQLARVHALNLQLEVLEREFSKVLSTGARLINQFLFWINFLAAAFLALVSITLGASVLRNIRTNEEKLIAHREKLSDLVEQRTKELIISNDRLQETLKIADAANQAKSEFLAKMSHEIRTPMNAIVGLSHLALGQHSSSEAQSYIEKIHLSSKIIISILNDILDLSKVEADKLALESIDFDLSELLQTLLGMVGVDADEKNIELLLDVGSDIGAVYIGDPHRLGQVLTNLLSNAIKFSEKGGDVVLRVQRSESVNGTDALHFSVKDNGIGMNDEEKSKLFQAFSQVDNSVARRYGGTGLGLMISRQLVQLMEGKIWVDSESGRGSEFHFTINLAKKQIAERIRLNKMVSASKRILIVDDNEMSRDILGRQLTTLGYEVSHANSGNDALQLFRSYNTSSAYDLMLVDWQMPGMNGVDTVRCIHNESLEITTPSIIMISGYNRSEMESEAVGVNISGVLQKPATLSAIKDALDLVFERPLEIVDKVPPDARVSDHFPNFVGVKLLLVEDNEINQEIAISLLARQGLELDCVDNGLLALEKLKTNDYDAILMDCQMPVLDGYETAREIRKQPKFRNMPILAMTANVTFEDRRRILDCGMDDLIAKPIDVSKMFETLENWLVRAGD